MNGQKCILVVEDNEDDFFLLRHAFERAGLSDKLVHAWNGEEALAYLAGEPPFSDRDQHPLPELLLCDLKMPRLDGFGLLDRLRSHRELSALPVVVLSSSMLERDAQKAKSLGVREYLVKPTDTVELRNLVLGLHQRWLRDGLPSVPKARSLLRILLRNYETGLFFKSATEWTPSQHGATAFASHTEAIKTAQDLCLLDTEILHVNEDGTRFLGLRLNIVT